MMVKATDENIRDLVEEGINKYGYNADLNYIDTSEVTDMAELFYNSNFNGDISKWDVSNVTSMYRMFQYSEFNGDVADWDVSNVEDFSYMFADSEFKNYVINWDISNGCEFECMFRCCGVMQSAYNGWDLSEATDVDSLEELFY